MNSKHSRNRPFEMVPGGKYDQNGFYSTPNGSFWDPDGVYFNREGFDNHGGFYDQFLEYHPGAGWIDDLMCYEDQKHEVIGQSRRRGRNDDDDLFDECDDIDIDNLEDGYNMGMGMNKEIQEEYMKYVPDPNSDIFNTKLGKEREKMKMGEEGNFNTNNTNNTNNVNNVNNTNNVNREIEKEEANTNTNKENKNENNDKMNVPLTFTPKTNEQVKVNKEEVKITEDQLFNKIPDNLKQDVSVSGSVSGNKQPVEKSIEVDALFG